MMHLFLRATQNITHLSTFSKKIRFTQFWERTRTIEAEIFMSLSHK